MLPDLVGPISRDTIAAIPPISPDTFARRLAAPQNNAISPPRHLASHRHICATPHFGTYRSIVVRYHTKTSTKEFARDTTATSIARYEISFPEKLGKFQSRAAKRGGFKRGGFPIWTCPSFFVLFCCPPFWDFPDFSGIFPICSGMVRGFSRFVLFLFLSLLRAPTRNSPERVRDTIWTFPEKNGKHPGLEPPRFSFSQSREPLDCC